MPHTRYQTIEVAVPLPVDRTFHYSVPEPLRSSVRTGVRVLVPFGRRKVTGYVLGRAVDPSGELKDIIEVLDAEPLFTNRETAFYRWITAYYLYPLGEVIKTALPSGINIESRRKNVTNDDGSIFTHEHLTTGKGIRREKFYHAASGAADASGIRGAGARILLFLLENGEASRANIYEQFLNPSAPLKRLSELGLISVEEREVYRDPFREEDVIAETYLCLNDHQAAAFCRIAESVSAAEFSPFLLHGVTGSGKTEVYLHAIAHTLEQGKRALVLTPEIALTPQLVRRFRGRFSQGIAVLHSGLSVGERYDEWRRIRRGEVAIVIGARSAIFAPLENLGIIVVDEEHEASYKQSEGVTYNARDLALVRGKLEKTTVVLGSATPLITTFHAAKEGRIHYLPLPERVQGRPMPESRILDIRKLKGVTFSPELIAAIAENLEKGGQTLLFLNRRGFATFLLCKDCGHIYRCPNCSVTLTHHRAKQRHFCHYCDYSLPAPSVCPECNGTNIGLFGRGTERLEDEVRELFPDARVARMDSDTTSSRGGHARILKRLEDGSIDILIGTQMIAKGHDYPGVTLVGIVSADATLNIPDFRSAERTFQLVSQVMGRAGRGDSPGKVIIQGISYDHYALLRAAAHDYQGFYDEEIAFREDAGYPPFSHLAMVVISGTAEKAVEKGAQDAARSLREERESLKIRAEILGPAPAPLAKVRGRFRWQILLKARNRTELKRLLHTFQRNWKPPRILRTIIDVDPVDTL
ncbi:MAG: primosomal protein N' [Geobacteraceae bacterium]|nr:primosomal protein N' [Geobacteraceae bacterium]